MASQLPFELLIEICSYLSPIDLYSLSMICKRYRKLLWSNKSATTQSIWRTARHKFVPHLTLQPPDDMSEQQFIYMMVLIQRCMFCEEEDRWKLAMHFEFRMYCCQRCLAERTVSRDTLIKEWELPTYLLPCMQPLTANAQRPQLFLMKEVKLLLNNYNKLTGDKERKIWITEKSQRMAKLKDTNREYNVQHDIGRYDHYERLERLFRTLHMSTDYPYIFRGGRCTSREIW
ncbi:6104_t:CDS:2 [Diversispora eburnea]|uniref:6104_t:CDS:1 n=1 Tax=Diversispora eburnea TaxID=1213867 RepID=A0A9N8VAN8_9GLOM|nr:6104_t:CDS:2 [Diversispora eburnea]